MTEHRKLCYRCTQEKPLSHFIKRIDDRYYNMCRVCVSEILAVRGKGKKKERLHHTETHRTCYLCRRFLLASEFTRRSTGTYFSACKECNKNVFGHRRRARKLAAEGSFTTKEWLEKKSQYDHCPRCMRTWDEIPRPPGRKDVITRDHIIPISKGGGNSIDNIQPLCYSCNSAKGDRLE